MKTISSLFTTLSLAGSAFCTEISNYSASIEPYFQFQEMDWEGTLRQIEQDFDDEPPFDPNANSTHPHPSHSRPYALLLT